MVYSLGVLKAGLASVVITPPVGVRLSGYANRTQPSTGIIDDLYAKALVLDDGNERLALVVCDLIGLSSDIVTDVRKRIRELAGIEEENSMITSIHTHTGPDLRYTGEGYIENLKSLIAGAVFAACNRLKESMVGAASGECLVGSNRRNPKSPTQPHFLYSWPEGPMDPTVLVLRIEDTAGHILGALVNYSCHPVSLGHRELMISRDYPSYALKVLEEAWNQDVVAIFMNGCCGNINPRWIYDKPGLDPPPPRVLPDKLKQRLKETKRLGNILGAEALGAAESITGLTSEVRLKSKTVEVSLPVREEFPSRMLDWMKRAKPGEPRYERNQRILRGEPIVTEVQVMALDEIAVVGLPGEVFVEYQIELRRNSPYKHTFISELANDSIGYVPVPKAYEEGGYEPTVTMVAPEAGEIILQMALDVLRSLK